MMSKKLPTILDDNIEQVETTSIGTVVIDDTPDPLLYPVNPIVQAKDRVAGNTAPVAPESRYEGRIKSADNRRYGVLTTQIQGHRFHTEHWYSQYIGKNDSSYDHNITSTKVSNQYIQISNVEMKLDSPMPNYSVDQNNKVTYAGTGTTPCLFIPNMGDLFTAYVDTGVLYLFKVSSAPKKNTIFDQAAYTFDFISVEDLSSSREIIDDVNSKVVMKKVFVSNLTNYTETCILVEEDYEIYQKLEKAKYELTEDYRDIFYDANIASLLIPSQPSRCYDPFTVNAFIDIRSFFTKGVNQDIDNLNAMDGSVKEVKTIWDSIKTGSGSRRSYVYKMKLVKKNYFTYKAYLRSIRYADLDLVMSPMGDESNSVLYAKGTKIGGIELTPSSVTVNGNEINIKQSTVASKLPLVNPVTNDEYYIFSRSFYIDKLATSQIEYLVLQMINEEVVNPTLLLELYDDCYNWGDVEFYYYVPIILYLIEQCLIKGL